MNIAGLGLELGLDLEQAKGLPTLTRLQILRLGIGDAVPVVMVTSPSTSLSTKVRPTRSASLRTAFQISSASAKICFRVCEIRER